MRMPSARRVIDPRLCVLLSIALAIACGDSVGGTGGGGSGGATGSTGAITTGADTTTGSSSTGEPYEPDDEPCAAKTCNDAVDCCSAKQPIAGSEAPACPGAYPLSDPLIS